MKQPPLTEREHRAAWIEQAAAEIVELVMSKRDDYGTLNINMTGQTGVATRALDKVARILHISRGSQPYIDGDGATKRDISYEPLSDSWRDLVGYALIGLWLEETGEPW